MVLKNCSLCGFCRSICPIFNIAFKETLSPRGKAILRKQEIFDKVFYICTLCGACKSACPTCVDINVKKVRAKLVELGIETKANKEMIENIRKFGNPFGN